MFFHLLCFSGLRAQIAADVEADRAEELANKPKTYNNSTIRDNAKALHKYFMAKHKYANMTAKQRCV